MCVPIGNRLVGTLAVKVPLAPRVASTLTPLSMIITFPVGPIIPALIMPDSMVDDVLTMMVGDRRSLNAGVALFMVIMPGKLFAET